ncbi:Fic family protein [Mucilaginibacter sp.]|uniref:Fic family protein n=1 Tax=Mucilaginibacter sp. TaxID=1882438 RepID=UPI002618329F|nr:Fic family protein [Mucilaginibacter sp.]MDB4922521.1 cell filamentation protein Fic [Mucilaginibacter sp.]
MRIFEPIKIDIRLKMYNWQQKDWPNFTYSSSGIEERLYLFSEKTGLISGVLKSLPENSQMDTVVEFMVYEAIKTSEIEGEYLSRKDVMSSIRNDLGLNKTPDHIADKKAKGIGDLIYNVRDTYQQPLSKKQLFMWHKMLLGTGTKLKVGAWRDHTAPTQVVSGTMGKEKVHYEALPSEKVSGEMDQFITWFNESAPGGKHEIKKAPIRSAIAHLYFESIHPFEDGNGRIGRAIAEKALSQGVGRPVLLSLSRTIEAKKNDYYSALEQAQKANEITPWISYFVDVIINAQQYTENHIDFTLKKTKFFVRFSGELNERQLKVIKRVLKEGPKGFERSINAGKYITISKASKATATRDLQDLLAKGAIILLGESGGRSTRYELNL